MSNIIPHIKPSDSGKLQFSKIEIDKDYRKIWEISGNDYFCLTKNGVMLRPTLYRIGGMCKPKLGEDKYFLLLKYKEAFFDKEILRVCKSDNAKHLKGIWCIVDENGNELHEFDNTIHHPYIIRNSCIYSLNNDYYNIVTGELYCNSYTRITSTEFIFLNNSYDKDLEKRGVMKVNLKDGTFELFK